MHSLTDPRPLLRFLMLASLPLAAACGSGGSGGDDGGAVVGGPEEGSWRYVEGDVTDGCMLRDPVSNGLGNFGISDSSSSGFHVIPNDGSDEFDCTLDGNEFVCDDRLVDSYMQSGVTIDVNVVASGRLTSRTAIRDGVQEASVTCTGSGCDLAATVLTDGGSFPCTIDIEYVADKN